MSCVSSRTTDSIVLPPGGNGTMTRTGRAGQAVDCANACAEANTNTNANAMRVNAHVASIPTGSFTSLTTAVINAAFISNLRLQKHPRRDVKALGQPRDLFDVKAALT